MTRRELILTIDHLLESSAALDHLRDLSTRDVDRLLKLLSSPSGMRSLRRLLEAVRLMRGSPRPASNKEDKQLFPGDEPLDLLRLLTHIFSDKARFPTVGSISDFVSENLGLRIPHEKMSRKRYISRVEKKIESTPGGIARVQQRLLNTELSEHDQAYKQLYDYIRGRHRKGNHGTSS